MQGNHHGVLNKKLVKLSLVSKDEVDFSFKVILLGDGAVGKTSIRRCFMGERFKQYYLPTIGADFSIKRIAIGNRILQFQIWDISGQPKFREIRQAYFLGAHGAIFVHDVTRPETLQTFSSWMDELWKHTGRGPVPVVILSNKIDLAGIMNVDFQAIKRQVEHLNAAYYQTHGILLPWLKTSAKTGENIDQAFLTLALQIMPDLP